MTKNKKLLTYDDLWKKSPPTPTANKNLNLILGSATNLPASKAMNLRFMGLVADQDIYSVKKGGNHGNR